MRRQGVFRSGTRVVSIFATVIDAQKRLVPDLAKADFEILDNEKPQEIQVFVNEVQPITVVVMLDTSASMTGNLALLVNAAEQFLIRLQPKDKGLVGAFNDKIEFFPATFTSDRDRLVRSLKDLDFGNPTRLYDAIHASIGRLKDIDGRRVVLVFTDGDDTDSPWASGKVLDEARNDEVMIYAIGLRSDYFNGQRQVRSRPDPGLKQLAEETGGGYFELEKSERPGAHVHARRQRAPQPVRARLRAGGAGRQGSPPDGARQTHRARRARPQELPGVRGIPTQ